MLLKGNQQATLSFYTKNSFFNFCMKMVPFPRACHICFIILTGIDLSYIYICFVASLLAGRYKKAYEIYLQAHKDFCHYVHLHQVGLLFLFT